MYLYLFSFDFAMNVGLWRSAWHGYQECVKIYLPQSVIQVQGFHWHFQQEGTAFHRLEKLFELNFSLYEKQLPLDGQTRQVISTAQPVSLPGSQSLMKPLQVGLYHNARFEENNWNFELSHISGFCSMRLKQELEICLSLQAKSPSIWYLSLCFSILM